MVDGCANKKYQRTDNRSSPRQFTKRTVFCSTDTGQSSNRDKKADHY